MSQRTARHRSPTAAFSACSPALLSIRDTRRICAWTPASSSPRALRVSGWRPASSISFPLPSYRRSDNDDTRMNFGGGFFGVGPPEVLVVLAVGWFVLGPKQLLELSRDVGKIIGQVRRAAGDARETFTDAVQTDIAEMEARENATKVEGPVLPGEDEPILETDEEIAAAAALSPPKENPLDTLKSLIDPEPPVRTQIQQAPPSVVQQQQSIFLDQLSRANDPAQTVPDLSMEDEEDEVARLEMQLQAAREKLQEKKKSENAAPPPPAAPAASNGTPNESNEATDKTR